MRPPLPLLLLLVAACDAATPDPAPTASAEATVAAPPVTAVASASAQSAGASQVREESDLYEFDYSYPAEAGRIAALRQWLDGERDKAQAQIIKDATEGRAEAREGGYEFHPYATGTAWRKVTETPRFLSLSADLYWFTGGAHPNRGFDSVLWDKREGLRRKPIEMFVSPARFDAAVRQRFCAELDRERAKRRGEPVVRDRGTFDDCISPAEQTVILGSLTGRTFDRVGILIGPYAAGPYVEGDYEITLPVTPALLATIKPEYRDAFAPR